MESHRCHFINYTPSGIVCVAPKLSGDTCHVALARANGDIELWRVAAHAVEAHDDVGAAAALAASAAKTHVKGSTKRKKSAATSEAPRGAAADAASGAVAASPRFVCERRVRGSITASFKSMAWCGERLFAAGLDATIYEVDFVSACTHVSDAATSTSAPAPLAAPLCYVFQSNLYSPNRLVAACNDGSIRLFSVTSDERNAGRDTVEYDCAFVQGASKRALCVSFSPDGRQIVSGDDKGMVTRWDAESGEELQVLSLPLLNTRSSAATMKGASVKAMRFGNKRQAKNGGGDNDNGRRGESTGDDKDAPANNVCVWCVKMLDDGTICCGDGNGGVHFFEAFFGTLVASFNDHIGAVLGLSVITDVLSNGLVSNSNADDDNDGDGDGGNGGDVNNENDKAGTVSGKAALVHTQKALAAFSNRIVVTTGADAKIRLYRHSPGSNISVKHEWMSLNLISKHTHDVMCCTALVLPFKENASAQLYFVTGGVDTSLLLTSVENGTRIVPQGRVNGFWDPPKLISFSGGNAALVATANESSIDIWRLGQVFDIAQPLSNLAEGEKLRLKRDHSLLLQVNINNNSAADAMESSIVAVAISSDGRHLAVATRGCTRLFALEAVVGGNGDDGDEHAAAAAARGGSVALVARRLTKALPPCTHLQFTHDCKHLVMSTCANNVHLLDLYASGKSSRGKSIEHRFSVQNDIRKLNNAQKSSYDYCVKTLAVSSDDRYLAVGDVCDRIAVYDLKAHRKALKAQHSARAASASDTDDNDGGGGGGEARSAAIAKSGLSLTEFMWAVVPLRNTIHTALAFHPVNHSLFVAEIGGGVYIYDTLERQTSKWTALFHSQMPPKEISYKRAPILGFAFNPSHVNTVYVWSSNWLCKYNLDKAPAADATLSAAVGDDSGGNKRRRSTASNTQQQQQQRQQQQRAQEQSDAFYQLVVRYRNCLLIDFMKADTIVVVEQPWRKVLMNLPPVVQTRKFQVTTNTRRYLN